MTTQKDIHTQASQSPIFRVERGGHHPEVLATPAAETPVRPLNSRTNETKKQSEQHADASRGLPDHVITQIQNAISNSIASAPPRIRQQLESMRGQILSDALRAAQGMASQMQPDGDSCPRWNQVVTGSINVAQKVTSKYSKAADTKAAHLRADTQPNQAQPMNSRRTDNVGPLPEDAPTLGLVDQTPTAGLDLGNAAMGGALLIGGALAVGALAGQMQIEDSNGPVGNISTQADDPHRNENAERARRGLPPVSAAYPSRAQEFLGPQLAVQDKHAIASDKFSERIEAQREQDALKPKELGASA